MSQNQDNPKKAQEHRQKVSKILQRSGSSSGGTEVAYIRLSGQWLEELGFGIGQRFVVRQSSGRIELVANGVEQGDHLKDQDHGPHR